MSSKMVNIAKCWRVAVMRKCYTRVSWWQNMLVIFMLINHLISSASSTCTTHKIQPLSVPPKAEESSNPETHAYIHKRLRDFTHPTTRASTRWLALTQVCNKCGTGACFTKGVLFLPEALKCWSRRWRPYLTHCDLKFIWEIMTFQMNKYA